MKFLVALLCCLTLTASGVVNVPPLFSDGMVLQQKTKLPIWGWGTSGAQVEVIFGNQTKRTNVSKDGKWMVTLEPLQASAKAATFTITVAGETKTIKDVLVGEVWLCSGQSNMDWTMEKLMRPPKNKVNQPVVDTIIKEVRKASDPLLRQIEVGHNTSLYKETNNFKSKWIKSGPTTNEEFTGTGYFFGRELRRELNVPVALIKCAFGGTRVEAWVPTQGYDKTDELKSYYHSTIESVKKDLEGWDEAKEATRFKKQRAEWIANQKAAKKKGEKFTQRAPRKPKRPDLNVQLPSTLFNGMISPLIPYAIKGTIWYQGEANANYCSDQYLQRFSALIESWRERWNQGDFPFYFAQLANYKTQAIGQAGSKGWVDVCNQQRQALNLKNTGMAVLNDIGEAEDIHPRNKIDVGRRLALWALANDYGKNLVCSGPLYRECSFKKSSALITFNSAGKGLTVGKKELLNPVEEVNEKLQGFEICGADGVWKWANAEIIGSNQVKVSHPEVNKPVNVRYAWAKYSVGANLYNKDGLPASLFTIQ